MQDGSGFVFFSIHNTQFYLCFALLSVVPFLPTLNLLASQIDLRAQPCFPCVIVVVSFHNLASSSASKTHTHPSDFTPFVNNQTTLETNTVPLLSSRTETKKKEILFCWQQPPTNLYTNSSTDCKQELF